MTARGRDVDRRVFLTGALAAVGGILAGCTSGPSTDARSPSAVTSASAASPSGSPTPTQSRAAEVGVAIIGAGGHGTKLATRFARTKGVRVRAICDADSARAGTLADRVRDITDSRPKELADLRRALDDPGIDAVAIAVPHHWHALAAVWALQAGKHVYLEKPATHNLTEGPAVLDQWRGSGLVVEVGTQRRSHPGLQEAIAEVHAGTIGEVQLARCYSWKRRPPIGPVVRGRWPGTLDEELWFGPRPVERPTRERFHYDWHWFTDFGNGGLGNNGVHRLDVARWGMRLSGIGSQVLSLGGRLGPADAGETPNTALTVVTFDDVAVVHDLRGLPTRPLPGMDPADEVAFIGEDASIVVNRTGGRLVDDSGSTVRTYGEDAADVDPIKRHIRGFIAAVRDSDPSAVAVGLEEGVGAAAMCHSPAAAHASVGDRAGQFDPDDAVDDVVELCGAGMAKHAEAFLAHARGQDGLGDLCYSGIRDIDGVEVERAPEEFEYQPGYTLPA